MKIILTVVLFALSAIAGAAFTEDTEIWTEIDRINGVIEGAGEMNSDALEELFQETVQVAKSFKLEQQFEDLRADAYATDNFTEIDAYADRAGDAINVFIMGESNNIGVNTTAFLDASTPETEAYSFFLVCVGGFYTENSIGTAEFPAWMIRTESSFQAMTVPELAEEWLGYWQSIRPSLDGYFLTIADETILTLTLSLSVE